MVAHQVKVVAQLVEVAQLEAYNKKYYCYNFYNATQRAFEFGNLSFMSFTHQTLIFGSDIWLKTPATISE